MSQAQQPPTTPAPPAQACTNCGATLAADQRYCLSCGTRVGEPRVAPAANDSQPAAPAPVSAPPPKSDVSPLAAVIGIALLGGMLLIGVLIGRGTQDNPPAPVVQVGDPNATASGGEIASEWPAGTNGFTIQLSTVAKAGATPESVDAATQTAIDGGAADAAVLDSDLYSSLPPGNYVIYSGVYTDRKSAEVALKGLTKGFPSATVVEVSEGSDQSQSSDASGGAAGAAEPVPDDVAPVTPAGGESEAPPATQSTTPAPEGGGVGSGN